jgi:hypothetical protein
MALPLLREGHRCGIRATAAWDSERGRRADGRLGGARCRRAVTARINAVPVAGVVGDILGSWGRPKVHRSAPLRSLRRAC